MSNLEKKLIADEGKRLFLYDDETGQEIDWNAVRKALRDSGHERLLKGRVTIGVGHNIEINGLSDDETDMIFANDLQVARKIVAHAILEADLLTPNRYDALVGMAFNLGSTGFRGFKKMIDAVKRWAFDEAADEIEDSDAYRKQPNRYGRYRDVMRTG